ncbi:MAG: hypothetical protein ACYC99_05100 [Candidatus Geothermincolia bacterium]
MDESESSLGGRNPDNLSGTPCASVLASSMDKDVAILGPDDDPDPAGSRHKRHIVWPTVILLIIVLTSAAALAGFFLFPAPDTRSYLRAFKVMDTAALVLSELQPISATWTEKDLPQLESMKRALNANPTPETRAAMTAFESRERANKAFDMTVAWLKRQDGVRHVEVDKRNLAGPLFYTPGSGWTNPIWVDFYAGWRFLLVCHFNDTWSSIVLQDKSPSLMKLSFDSISERLYGEKSMKLSQAQMDRLVSTSRKVYTTALKRGTSKELAAREAEWWLQSQDGISSVLFVDRPDDFAIAVVSSDLVTHFKLPKE